MNSPDVNIPYPNSEIVLWLARDQNNHVAAFDSSGWGPIPRAILLKGYLTADDMEDQIMALPVIGKTRMASFIDTAYYDDTYAERGLSFYDWVIAGPCVQPGTVITGYTCRTAPTIPIDAGLLTPALTDAIEDLWLPNVEFAQTQCLNLSVHLDMRVPGDEELV